MPYIGSQPSQQAFVTDTYNGTGSTTVFTMSVAPANTSSVLVAISGVLQDPSTYSVSGLTLTFSQAPPPGTLNISCRYLGIPASGVTTTAYRTVTEFTATAGQTTFTPASYTAGYINVYRNGVRLGSADYTASNGTTVVLAKGATAGDLVTTESFYVSSVLNAIPATAGSVISSYLSPSLTLTTPTLTSPTINGTYTAGTSLITSGTSAATTSGTSVDFTSIPSWVKRITVMFTSVSTNGTSLPQLQIGSGSAQTTGYVGASTVLAASTMASTTFSTGFPIFSTSVTSSSVYNGNIVLTLEDSTNRYWSATGIISDSNRTYTNIVAGYVVATGTLDRVRITTVNGTDTFDAGSINILYE
jgi:hypothetical protein